MPAPAIFVLSLVAVTGAHAADCAFRADPDAFLERQSRSIRELYMRTMAIPGKAGVRRTVAASELPRRNFIDDEIFGALAQAGVPAAALSSDEEFVRRITLDLAGLPRYADDPSAPDTGSTGNGGGASIVDMGAFERMATPAGNCADAPSLLAGSDRWRHPRPVRAQPCRSRAGVAPLSRSDPGNVAGDAAFLRGVVARIWRHCIRDAGRTDADEPALHLRHHQGVRRALLPVFP